MRILHYMLGIPPVRGGGLVKYAHDLMMEQQNSGEEVILLIPGSVNRKRRNENHIVEMRRWECRIQQYEIKNALPIAMANGVQDIEWFTAMGNYEVYENFLCAKRPDIIHVHSLMGIHANFFIAARKLEIPIVFTTHDYFGICPATELVNCEGNCDRMEWELCRKCCESAFSNFHLVAEQSGLFRIYCNSRFLMDAAKMPLDFMRFWFTTKSGKKAISSAPNLEKDHQKDYGCLKEYYQTIFRQITLFHYNSSIARNEYEKRIPFAEGKTIPITNAEIKDRREIKTFGKTLKIGYMGRITRNKGYYFLQDAIQQVIQSGRTDIELHVYTWEREKYPDWVHVHEPYNYTELGRVMRQQDIVAVPSLWRETFGFTALEAISYGIPVILTEYVGAKDLLKDREWGYQVAAIPRALFEVIERIYDDRSLLQKMNRKICSDAFEFSMEGHAQDIKLLYREAIEKIKRE